MTEHDDTIEIPSDDAPLGEGARLQISFLDDWYMAVVPAGQRSSFESVRFCTSGARSRELTMAVALMHAVARGEIDKIRGRCESLLAFFGIPLAPAVKSTEQEERHINPQAMSLLYTAITQTLNSATLLEDDRWFQHILGLSMAMLSMDDADVAGRLPVSRSSVARWRHGSSIPLPSARKTVYKMLLRAVVRTLPPIPLTECPGPDCPMCNGEMCDLCGAGCWRKIGEGPICEHDVYDRHREPPSSETTTPSSRQFEDHPGYDAVVIAGDGSSGAFAVTGGQTDAGAGHTDTLSEAEHALLERLAAHYGETARKMTVRDFGEPGVGAKTLLACAEHLRKVASGEAVLPEADE